MIIDSHFHLAIDGYNNTFSYLDGTNGIPLVRPAVSRKKLLEEYKKNGIVTFIDPAIGMSYNERSLHLYNELSGTCQYYRAVGNHPGKCFDSDSYYERIYTANGIELSKRHMGFFARWKMRYKLDEYARHESVIAIGECGFDYRKGRNNHLIEQKRWFVYQIRLADRFGLPLILHIRDSAKRAISVLRKNKDYLNHGGVWHCYNEDPGWAEIITQEFDRFYIGIGGYLFHEQYRDNIEASIKMLPLERILLETDGPYCMPPNPNRLPKTRWETALKNSKKNAVVQKILCEKKYHLNRKKKLLSNKKYKKARNSSLILPMIINRIAEIKGVSPGVVEEITSQNVKDLFKI